MKVYLTDIINRGANQKMNELFYHIPGRLQTIYGSRFLGEGLKSHLAKD